MEKKVLLDNFFTKERPHDCKKEKDEDTISFKWGKEVNNGEKKAILTLKK